MLHNNSIDNEMLWPIVTEMKSKNIDTIKTLISVAHTDGNYLGTPSAKSFVKTIALFAPELSVLVILTIINMHQYQ